MCWNQNGRDKSTSLVMSIILVLGRCRLFLPLLQSFLQGSVVLQEHGIIFTQAILLISYLFSIEYLQQSFIRLFLLLYDFRQGVLRVSALTRAFSGINMPLSASPVHGRLLNLQGAKDRFPHMYCFSIRNLFQFSPRECIIISYLKQKQNGS